MEEIRKIAEQRGWLSGMLLNRLIEYKRAVPGLSDKYYASQPEDGFKGWEEMLNFVINFIKEMNLQEDCIRWLENYKDSESHNDARLAQIADQRHKHGRN